MGEQRTRMASAALLVLAAVSCSSESPDSLVSAADASTVDGQPRPQRPDAAPCDLVPGSQTVELSGAIETVAVPPCVVFLTIEAFGAGGGNGSNPAHAGGRGARIRATFPVFPGQELLVLAGGRGLDGIAADGQQAGTGGGGSFVVAGGDRPLLVAGGGGGGTTNGIGNASGGDGQLDPAGQTGGNGGAGGIDGLGGTTSSNSQGFHTGTGGGGFVGDGVGASDGIGMWGTSNGPGLAFLNGGASGSAGSQGRPGGFGGGGAAGFTGGGGGGYGGGGAAFLGGPHAGGGGGSFSAETATDIEREAGVEAGNGRVILSW